MTHAASPKPASLYPTRSAAGALLGQQLAGRGYIGCILLGVTPEGVEIAASAAKAMGAQFDVLVAAFIKLGSNLAPAKAAEQLSAKQVVIATPVGTQAAVDRIRARRYDLVCPSVVVEPKGHPAPYGDMTGETPERLRSIMIAHQAA